MCNTVVKLIQERNQFVASRDDIYNYLNGENNFADNRTDPPHLAEDSDWLAFNAFIDSLGSIISGSGGDANAKAGLVDAVRGQWPIVQKLCTRELTGV